MNNSVVLCTMVCLFTHIYGSLYVTLCFVLCPFDFVVLTIEFSVLCTMLHILNGALYEVKPRWRTNEEKKTRE